MIIQEWQCSHVELKSQMIDLELGSNEYRFTLASPGNNAIEVWLDKSAALPSDESVAIILDNVMVYINKICQFFGSADALIRCTPHSNLDAEKWPQV